MSPIRSVLSRQPRKLKTFKRLRVLKSESFVETSPGAIMLVLQFRIGELYRQIDTRSRERQVQLKEHEEVVKWKPQCINNQWMLVEKLPSTASARTPEVKQTSIYDNPSSNGKPVRLMYRRSQQNTIFSDEGGILKTVPIHQVSRTPSLKPKAGGVMTDAPTKQGEATEHHKFMWPRARHTAKVHCRTHWTMVRQRLRMKTKKPLILVLTRKEFARTHEQNSTKLLAWFWETCGERGSTDSYRE